MVVSVTGQIALRPPKFLKFQSSFLLLSCRHVADHVEPCKSHFVTAESSCFNSGDIYTRAAKSCLQENFADIGCGAIGGFDRNRMRQCRNQSSFAAGDDQMKPPPAMSLVWVSYSASGENTPWMMFSSRAMQLAGTEPSAEGCPSSLSADT